MLSWNERGEAVSVIQAIEADHGKRLEALPAHIAVLDAEGSIKLINPTWKAFAQANGGCDQAYLGENYLDVCRQSASSDEDAGAARDGIKAVLAGNLPQFALEYPCHSPSVQRWFRMEVAPLDLQQRSSVLVSHMDVTEIKLEQITLREIVENVQETLANIGFNVSRRRTHRSSNAPTIQDVNNISRVLGETVVDAHYLAAQMLEFVKRKDFTEKDATRFAADLINDWARSVGAGLFEGQKFFDGEDAE